jgi:hypothetical protein
VPGNEDQLVLYTVSDYADRERRIDRSQTGTAGSPACIGGRRF